MQFPTSSLPPRLVMPRRAPTMTCLEWMKNWLLADDHKGPFDLQFIDCSHEGGRKTVLSKMFLSLQILGFMNWETSTAKIDENVRRGSMSTTTQRFLTTSQLAKPIASHAIVKHLGMEPMANPTARSDKQPPTDRR